MTNLIRSNSTSPLRSREVELTNSLGIAVVNKNTELAKSVIDETSGLDKKKLPSIANILRQNCTIEEWKWFQSLLIGDELVEVIEPLADDERELKNSLEQSINKTIREFFIDTGRHLHTLKERRLYREEFTTWLAYCQFGLGINVTTANRNIKAYLDSEVIKSLCPSDYPIPCTDYILRVLGSIKDDELKAKVWKTTIDQVGDKPTTADINRVYAEVVDPSIPTPKPTNLSYRVGDLVSIKEGDVKWGKVIAITSGLRYRIKSGDITSTYQAYQVSDIAIPQYIANAVEKLYQTYKPTVNTSELLGDVHPHTKSIATTFYLQDSFESWQITLLGELSRLCQ